jgi:hypothetical protein
MYRRHKRGIGELRCQYGHHLGISISVTQPSARVPLSRQHRCHSAVGMGAARLSVWEQRDILRRG